MFPAETCKSVVYFHRLQFVVRRRRKKCINNKSERIKDDFVTSTFLFSPRRSESTLIRCLTALAYGKVFFSPEHLGITERDLFLA